MGLRSEEVVSGGFYFSVSEATTDTWVSQFFGVRSTVYSGSAYQRYSEFSVSTTDCRSLKIENILKQSITI